MKQSAGSGVLLAALLAGLAACGGSGSGSKSSDSDDTPAKDAGDKHPGSKPHQYPAVDHDASSVDDAGQVAVGAMDAGSDAGAGSDAASAGDAQTTDAGSFGPTCSPVTLMFEGTVATVADTPLGLDDSVRDTDVSGSFAYLPCLPDEEPDLQRGIYEHPSGGNFSLSVGGLTVGGSGGPRLEVENFDPDTIRWRDGDIPLDDRVRVMTVDGEPAPTVEVTVAITDGAGAALSSDVPPTAFPYLDIASYPHTFSVSDANGTLLLQLSSMTQM